MNMLTNIKIVGTDHLMPKEKIKEIIEKENPDVVGVELCHTRYSTLVMGSEQKVQEEKKEKSLIGKISESIRKKAEEEKLEYGSDMIYACKFALEKKIPIRLLDRDISEIKVLMDKIPQQELLFFQQELLKFQNQSMKDSVKDLDENEVLTTLKEKSPIAFELLINSRDNHITKEILKLKVQCPNLKILIFLGKGHVKSITEDLEK